MANPYLAEEAKISRFFKNFSKQTLDKMTNN